MNKTKLKKTLSLPQAVALAITMVVGSGLMVIPGLAYKNVGANAIYSWLICALASIPLLYILANLGASYPGAGGIAGYMRSAFSDRMGIATEALIFATIPGGAALALTGGKYISELFAGGKTSLVFGTAFILIFGVIINLIGSKLSGRVQQILAFIIIATLSSVAIIALTKGDLSVGARFKSPVKLLDGLPAVGLVFFSFVGWEMMSFTSEEFENPKRDFPLMIILSFVIVVALYALIASAVQLTLSPSNSNLSTAPIAELLNNIIGHYGYTLVVVIGCIIALANYTSIVWAFSRLAFSSAREGILPSYFAVLSKDKGIPSRSIWMISIVFSLIALFNLMGLADLSLLFELAGISFFLSYILCVIAYIKISKDYISRTIGIITLILEISIYLSFGTKAAYPLVFLLLGYLLSKNSSKVF